MTLRRYAPIAPSKGTVIPPQLRLLVLDRDRGCVGPTVGMPGDCAGGLELDHVRASHGIGMKSETTAANLVALCGTHHRWKTEHGREVRPALLDYLHGLELGDHQHVDPMPGCSECYELFG